MLTWHLHQIELEELDEEDFAPPPATNSRREALQVHRLKYLLNTYFELWYFWATLLHAQHGDDMSLINWICDWSVYTRWGSCLVGTMGLLAADPRASPKSDLRWDDHCGWALALNGNCWSQHLEMGQYWQKVDMRQWKLNQSGSFFSTGRSNQVEHLICARISESSFSYCEMFAFRWRVGRGWATHSGSRGWDAPREATTCRQVLRFMGGWLVERKIVAQK